MGQTDEQDIEQRKRKRGKPAPKESTSLLRRQVDSQADLSSVDPALVGRAVQAVVSADNAVMFGATQDGGAVCVTLFADGQRDKTYAHSTEEIEFLLEGMIQDYGR